MDEIYNNKNDDDNLFKMKLACSLSTLFKNYKYKKYILSYFYLISKQNYYPLYQNTDMYIYDYLHKLYTKLRSKDNIIIDKQNNTNRISLRNYNIVESVISAQSAVILDVGTTDCVYINKLTSRYGKAYGINIESYDTYSYQGDTNCITLYDGKHIPFDDNYFDAVTIYMVLHHVYGIETQINLIREIKRVLKPNGMIIISDHDVTNRDEQCVINFVHFFFELSYNIICNKQYYDEYMATYTSLNGMKQMLEQCGFKIYTDYFRPPKPIIKSYVLCAVAV